jgi:hypothetical protein
MRVHPGSGKNRIKMITMMDIIRKRLHEEFDEADHKAFSTILDCFVDSFLTQAETVPPHYEPLIPRARLANIIEQINKIGSKHKDSMRPTEAINLALTKAEQIRNSRGKVWIKNPYQKDHLDLIDFLLVLKVIIRHSFGYFEQDSSAVVFKSKVNIKNMSDSLQIVTMEYQQEELNDLYFSLIEFLKSQHNVR